MLTVTGKVFNVYKTLASTDPQTGEIRDSRTKVQLMGVYKQTNGEERYELLDLRTDRGVAFEAAKGKFVRVPVKVWNIDGASGVYTPKGVEIELVDEKGANVGSLDQVPSKKAS